MPDDQTAAIPPMELDEEAKRLRLEAEKASYAEAIAKARQAAADANATPLTSIVPTVTDAPKGAVTLGEKAGAFGPWRAHQLVERAAAEIACAAAKTIAAAEDAQRTLVVNDRDLLPHDWTARHVQAVLDRLNRRLAPLVEAVGSARAALAAAVTTYQDEEAQAAEDLSYGRRGVSPDIGAVSAAPVATGAWSSAVALLGLLRTDYTVSAVAVTAAPAELSTLTAAQLAAKLPAGKEVEADTFATVRESTATDTLTAVLLARDKAADELAALRSQLATVETDLAAIKASLAAAAPAPDADDPPRPRKSQLEQVARRDLAAAPARAAVAYAQQVVADADTAVAALLTAPPGGEPPMLTAVRRERLSGDGITHVLYVSLDALAADAVTRRSIIGTSGLIRFLSAGNASWLLLRTSTGAVVAGGQISVSDVATFGLEAGGDGAWKPAEPPKAEPVSPLPPLPADPLPALERTARILVITLVVVLVVLGLLSFAAITRVVVTG